MIPHGWNEFNSLAAFFPESFELTGQEQYLFAWVVKNEKDVQAWLEDLGGWDGSIYDADPVDAAGFISRAEHLFSLPTKSNLPDLSWVVRGWIAYEGADEVSMVGEGENYWMIVYYTLGSYVQLPEI